ncbi:hypothetical protein J3R30DRAFT_3291614 [Lentinula aciculospora]|uniref:MOCS2A n=1 Tax=Lentinula aciculospora TaxID=153920 RepID=A0A9W9A8P8_9AGAR|nr:hypothetical protein J3R30DRAFT_3291614 [Lentinula aciculospora]
MSSTFSTNSPAYITVLYFAAASTTLGISEELISIPSDGFYLFQLTDLLIERHSLSDGDTLRKVLDSSQWSVNAEMVDDEDLTKVELKDGMEVAVICPVSGG